MSPRRSRRTVVPVGAKCEESWLAASLRQTFPISIRCSEDDGALGSRMSTLSEAMTSMSLPPRFISSIALQCKESPCSVARTRAMELFRMLSTARMAVLPTDVPTMVPSSTCRRFTSAPPKSPQMRSPSCTSVILNPPQSSFGFVLSHHFTDHPPLKSVFAFWRASVYADALLSWAAHRTGVRAANWQKMTVISHDGAFISAGSQF